MSASPIVSQLNDMFSGTATRRKIKVFGSNEAGIHGAGAAKDALDNHGAIMGQGVGLQGNSYAIPTKSQYSGRDGTPRIGRTLTLDAIKVYVDEFIAYAEAHPEFDFEVTQIGCGYAGLVGSDVAPLFEAASGNCSFDSAWEPYFISTKSYWGTF